YGLTAGYGSTLTYGNVGSGNSPVTVTSGLGGLLCATTYHYRAWAQSTAGTTYGGDVSFTTGPCAGSLIAGLGPGTGIWADRDPGGWTQLDTVNAARIATGDLDGNGQDEVIVDDGPSYGIWALYN